ncbi:MAG: hypothetical protein ACETWR_12600 [Anaerolineae bacterium]
MDELLGSDSIWVWMAALLTIMVYSYLLGDNPLYRLAEHLFIGSSVAYAVVVVIHGVVGPLLLKPLTSGETGERLLAVVPLVLGLLLWTKLKTSWAWLGNFSLAFLLGVGAALAVGGALLGSILPQVRATISAIDLFGLERGLIIVIGTLSTLLYFHFAAGTKGGLSGIGAGFIRAWARLGRWFIMIAFGAIFANTVMARISLLIGRVQFLLQFSLDVFGI